MGSSQTPISYEGRPGDIIGIIENCFANLNVLDGFILKSKECIRERQAYQTAIQNIQAGLKTISQNTTIMNLESDLENKIGKIVENAIESKMVNLGKETTPLGPTYSQILNKNLTNTRDASVIVPPKLPQANYKVVIKPDESLKHIKTSEDTRKLLTSKPPKNYGIKVNKITPLRNNALLIESNCQSILGLPENQVLKSLNLHAERVNKVWPKMQIFDVPNDMNEADLISAITSQQDPPDNLPESFIKTAFKTFGNSAGKHPLKDGSPFNFSRTSSGGWISKFPSLITKRKSLLTTGTSQYTSNA